MKEKKDLTQTIAKAHKAFHDIYGPAKGQKKVVLVKKGKKLAKAIHACNHELKGPGLMFHSVMAAKSTCGPDSHLESTPMGVQCVPN